MKRVQFARWRVFLISLFCTVTLVVACGSETENPFCLDNSCHPDASSGSGGDAGTGDPCEGECGPGTVCNPSDKKCYPPGTVPCGGKCGPGTTCDPVQNKCIGGSSSDPCGGFCAPGTTCNVGTGKCEAPSGGDPCKGHCAPPLTICDPVLGQCVPGPGGDGGGGDGGSGGNCGGHCGSGTHCNPGTQKCDPNGDGGAGTGGDSGTGGDGGGGIDPCMGACGPGTECNPVTKLCVAERCDGIDNNGNTLVDEGWDIGLPCMKGTGDCTAFGNFVCDGLWASRCNAIPGSPTAEVCDQHDNNCNTLVDEGLLTCVCTPNPAGEICGNLIDDDCDGIVDEDCYPGSGSGGDGGAGGSDGGGGSGGDGGLPCGGFCGPGTVCSGGSCILTGGDGGSGGSDGGSDAGGGGSGGDGGPPCGGFCSPGTVCLGGLCVPASDGGGGSGGSDGGADAGGGGSDAGDPCGGFCGAGTSCDVGSGMCVPVLPCGGVCGPGTMCSGGVCVPTSDGGGGSGGADSGTGGSGGDGGLPCGGACGPGTVCTGGVCLPVSDGGGGSGGSDGGGSGGSGGSDAGGPCSGSVGVCALSGVCTKIIHLNAGVVIPGDSSPNNSTCSAMPWTVNALVNESVGYAANLAPGQSITFNFSPGKVPKSIYYKCASSAPSPGPAPTRDQLFAAVFSGGFILLSNPLPGATSQTIGSGCPSNWVNIVLNF